MQVKLTWSYNNTTTGGTAPTKFLVQYKLSSLGSWPTGCTAGNNTTQSGCIQVDAPFTSVCSGGSCIYTISASLLDDNKSYDFRVGTEGTECAAQFTTSVSKINVLCPTFTPTATSSTISYSFSGAVNTSVTGYLIELYPASGTTPISSKPLESVVATHSGSFSNIGLTGNTSYVLRVTVKSSGADKVCNYTITTSTTPPCVSATSLTACMCNVDAGCNC